MNKANLEKLPQSEGADYFIVLDPKEGIVHHTYTADLGRSFGHDHIKDAQLDGVASAARWVVRPLFTAEPDLLTDRDEAEEFADKILDLVLGTDRHEWTSRYGRADALLEVEDKMATAAAPQHSDDVAVDQLSAAMKAKLAKQRAKGYRGWDDSECTREWLSNLLREHVDKGDPVDVANFCAFLSARGEGIAPAEDAPPAFPAMTEELASILGLMCFQCISFAHALRAGGYSIKKRAEDEQAAVLHWMLGHYFRSGPDGWRAAASADMERLRESAAKEGAQQS
ncbi:hypothetical protein O987_06965 [Comamonas testosteroni TK102]|uniref:Uncharacterized protein n=1 Tax=Comamonas testosteroni TK102 TaxID=1392005 RepID=A0A076PLJ0_COMTE|nr:hypothetical protein [Comamonas testosteroni]AIJ45536.1 hypothetical protein O987_06965 [Comamonas testosteroni TK102]